MRILSNEFSRPLLKVMVASKPCLSSTSAKTNTMVQQAGFLEQFMRSRKPPQESIDYFSSVGWTRRIVEDKAYEIVPFWSRYMDSQTGENRFFASTVNTRVTIPHLLSMRLKHMPDAEAGPNPRIADTGPDITQSTTKPEVKCLMSLGRALEAHPSIVHGGFQCVLIDEVTRFLILVHQNNVRDSGTRLSHYTVSMATSYFAPVITPGNVLVRSQLLEKQGRKWTVATDITDASGKVLTSAKSVWVTARRDA